MTRVTNDIVRGRLSEREIQRIEDLADQGWKSGRIAIKLNRHPCTISHHMVTRGFRQLSGRVGAPYSRNGYPVVPFTPREDQLIERLSLAGKKNREICSVVKKDLGHTRSPHTIAYRLRMLAATAEMKLAG
jgi:IS30 family transposase